MIRVFGKDGIIQVLFGLLLGSHWCGPVRECCGLRGIKEKC